MIEQSILLKLSSPGLAESTTSQLRQEYLACQNLFEQQPVSIQQHLESQAALITKALVSRAVHINYSLPEAVSLRTQSLEGQILPIPVHLRHQSIGSFINQVIHIELQDALFDQLSRLERSTDPAVTAAAVLLRHAMVIYMVHNYLPDGKPVQYVAEEGDEIPCTLVNSPTDTHLAVGFETDGVDGIPDSQIGTIKELDRARFSASGGFFVTQWVVVDDRQHLLVGDLCEAIAGINAMRQYLSVLAIAAGLAPYIVVDEVYQNKHYGILGQLVNQGRALASYQVELLCQTIKCRAAEHRLDRGLTISLPYFNDQTLTMETYAFDVIPGGRVMFVPAFVVLAVRAEAAKVAQNTRLNQSTRKNLLKELSAIERAFLR